MTTKKVTVEALVRQYYDYNDPVAGGFKQRLYKTGERFETHSVKDAKDLEAMNYVKIIGPVDAEPEEVKKPVKSKDTEVEVMTTRDMEPAPVDEPVVKEEDAESTPKKGQYKTREAKSGK